MRSPPTSPAIDARSWVDAITLNLPCADTVPAAESSSTTMYPKCLNLINHSFFLTSRPSPFVCFAITFVPSCLKGMGAMGADRKLELEQEFVGGHRFGVSRPPQLTAYLAELTGPVGQRHRLRGVVRRREIRPIRAIDARAGEPAASHLVVARHVIPGRLLLTVGLIPPAPDHFRSADERVVDRPLQRPPPHRGVHAEQVGREPPDVHTIADAGSVVAVRVRRPEIEIGRLGNVVIPAQVTDIAQVAALVRLKHVVRIAAEHLP